MIDNRPNFRHLKVMKQTDKRKREHPLFNGMPSHVRKLRESAAKNKRLKDRRDFMERQNDVH